MSTTSITAKQPAPHRYQSLSWDGYQFTVSHIEHDVTVFGADTTRPRVRFRIAEYGYGDGDTHRGRYTDIDTPLDEADGWPAGEDPRLEPPAWFKAAVEAMLLDLLDLRAALVADLRAENLDDRRHEWADDHRHYTATVLGGRVL